MKKKILLATVVAAACCAPAVAMADAKIYGQFRYSINSSDSDTSGGPGSTLSGADNVSLFGLKAETGEDIKAFIHLQTGANADGDGAVTTTTTVPVLDAAGIPTGDTVDVTTKTDGGRAFAQRFYFGGLKGAFGTVAYGRMTNAYKMPGFKLDPFYNMSHVGAGGTLATGLATYGLSGATNGFTDNAVQYTSPAMSGLKVNVGLYVDDTAADDHGNNIGVSYEAGKFNVGIQLASNGKTPDIMPGVIADGDAMRIHGGYKEANWSAGFSYENVDLTATTDANYMYLVGRYNAAAETELVLTLGSVSDGPAEGSGYNGAVFQTVAPSTQVYALYSKASLDSVASGAGKEPAVLSVGAIHKF